MAPVDISLSTVGRSGTLRVTAVSPFAQLTQMAHAAPTCSYTEAMLVRREDVSWILQRRLFGRALFQMLFAALIRPAFRLEQAFLMFGEWSSRGSNNALEIN